MSFYDNQSIEEEDSSTPVTSTPATSTPVYFTYDSLISNISSQQSSLYTSSPMTDALNADPHQLPLISTIPELRAHTLEALTWARSPSAVPDSEAPVMQPTPTTPASHIPTTVFDSVEVTRMTPSAAEFVVPALPAWPVYGREAAAPSPTIPAASIASVIPVWEVYCDGTVAPDATISVPSLAQMPVLQAPAPANPFRQLSEDAFMGYYDDDDDDDDDDGLAAGTSVSTIGELEWLEYLNQVCNDNVTDDMIRDLFPLLVDNSVEPHE
ncbi:hypothetical protein F4776DRAFT_630691 [Hypoxylon sp. NC0597]|nr:hypothetical protein F4776DRAFT_630691 [Hypoxylon sp. NC0597]